jgi:hypothetical protein
MISGPGDRVREGREASRTCDAAGAPDLENCRWKYKILVIMS